MGYTPAFDTIYTGTLFGRWPAAPVWASLLPLVDKRGEINLSYEAIAGMTGWPMELLCKGIDDLMQPDPGSRTEAEDGRRLILIDPRRPWGWRVVNHSLYREKARKQMHNEQAVGSGANAHRMRERRLGNPERKILFERDRGLCGICGEPVDLDSAQIDHIIPVSRGGGEELSNKQLAHEHCNKGKSGGHTSVPWRSEKLPRTGEDQPRPAKDTKTGATGATGDDRLSDSYADSNKRERGDRAKRSRRAPLEFSPDLDYARSQIPDLDADREAQKFRDWEFKTPRSDWAATWRNWVERCRDSGNYARKPNGSAPPGMERVRW